MSHTVGTTTPPCPCPPCPHCCHHRCARARGTEGALSPCPDPRAVPAGALAGLADLRSAVLSLVVTVAQCLLFSVFAAVPVLPVQFGTFALQVISRSFLYGGNAAFLAIA